ncbi:MAG: hypothetical protein ACI915_000347 [Gammaproteobacteria bacterium]|jgi:hypothetical protein
MEINLADVHAEITDVFWKYTIALKTNDIDTVMSSFWNSAHTLRYGTGENLYGIDEIARFRNTQRGKPIELEITRLVITAFNRDFGTANCEMNRTDLGLACRMSHSWVRFVDGWRIVAAHVSFAP